jgi:hypothetical protein
MDDLAGGTPELDFAFGCSRALHVEEQDCWFGIRAFEFYGLSHF